MYNADFDVLFPPSILPSLSNIRGTVWRELVSNVITAGPDSEEQIAFVLMMARINNCNSCTSSSYRAINGCTLCTKQSLKRIHESDQTLKDVFFATKREVEKFLQTRRNLNKEV